MGELVPFPVRKRSGTLIDSHLLKTRVLAGEADLIGVFWFNGGNCACYRLDHDDVTTFVFDVNRTPDPSGDHTFR